MTPAEELIRQIDERDNFAPLEDGFIYWVPGGGGVLSSWMLRAIADELDKRNEKWESEIESYFRQFEPCRVCDKPRHQHDGIRGDKCPGLTTRFVPMPDKSIHQILPIETEL